MVACSMIGCSATGTVYGWDVLVLNVRVDVGIGVPDSIVDLHVQWDLNDCSDLASCLVYTSTTATLEADKAVHVWPSGGEGGWGVADCTRPFTRPLTRGRA